MAKDLPRHWIPLTEITQQEFKPTRPEVLKECMDHYGVDEAAARKMLEDEHAKCRFFVNALYQIAVQPYGNEMLHICIRRRDGSMVSSRSRTRLSGQSAKRLSSTRQRAARSILRTSGICG